VVRLGHSSAEVTDSGRQKPEYKARFGFTSVRRSNGTGMATRLLRTADRGNCLTTHPCFPAAGAERARASIDRLFEVAQTLMTSCCGT